nr:hypothetical protein CFP56_66705 [Quercus suber]
MKAFLIVCLLLVSTFFIPSSSVTYRVPIPKVKPKPGGRVCNPLIRNCRRPRVPNRPPLPSAPPPPFHRHPSPPIFHKPPPPPTP